MRRGWVLLLLLLLGATALAGPNPYTVLGVSPTNSHTEIRAAYRKLAKRYHPDVNPGDLAAEEKMKEINAAWDILSDPDRRARYDSGDNRPYSSRTSPSRESAEEYKARRQEEQRQQAAEIGKKYSNDQWRFDPSTNRIYDSRTRKWLHVDDLWGRFYSDEGWLFSPESGKYLSTDLGAEWDPADRRGWHRKVSNSGNEYIAIDPKTGFSLATDYRPKTVSDASHLFDELFNPVNVLDHKAGRGNRANLLKKVAALSWTPEQKADYVERARAHIKIFQHKDMKPRFTTHAHYFDTFIEALVDHPKTLENPAIIQEFIRELPHMREELIKTFLVKNDWLKHPNAPQWLEEAFKAPNGTREFVKAIFRSNEKIQDAANCFSRVYPLMAKVGMPPESILDLIGYVGYRGTEGFEAFREPLLKIAKSPQYLELIAGVDPKQNASIKKFIEWHGKSDPEAARIFDRTLSMKGTRWDDFWRITPDHTEYRFHEREFKAARTESMRNRLKYMEEQFSALVAKSPEKEAGQATSGSNKECVTSSLNKLFQSVSKR